MSARLIDGKAFAEALRRKIGTYAMEFEAAAGRKAGLAVVLVGEDPASEVYIRSKGQAMVAAGMDSFEYRLAADAGEAALLARVKQLNADPNIDGILVQLPLPEGFDEDRVISAIDPDKDVDGFHIVNAGRLAVGEKGIVPCTPLGCMALLKDCCGDLAGMEAVVIGRSNIVGRPMAQLLTRADATVTVAHSRTKNLAEVVKRADIVVAAAGRAELVKGEWIKPGAVVIDVGINRVTGPDGSARLVGDVDFAAAREVAGAITPVPGGVGPMTIAMLLRNTLVSACHREGIPIDEDAL